MSAEVRNCSWAKTVQEEPGDMTHYAFTIVMMPEAELYIYPHNEGATLKGYMHESIFAFCAIWKDLEDKSMREQSEAVPDYWLELSSSDEDENPYTVASAIRCAKAAFKEWSESYRKKETEKND